MASVLSLKAVASPTFANAAPGVEAVLGEQWKPSMLGEGDLQQKVSFVSALLLAK
jgi:hypothetical protein